MGRFAASTAMATLGLASITNVACSQSDTGLATASIPSVPATVTTADDAMERARQVATISARAQKCGLVFDAAKLRSSYLRYETDHGATSTRLGLIERQYDATYEAVMVPSGLVCPQQDTDQIQSRLKRYMAGYFTPRTNNPTAFSDGDAPFDPAKFWKTQDAGGRSSKR